MGDKDNWTLEDIAGHDIDNLKTLLKKDTKSYSFTQVHKVVAFAGQALNKALMKHGINLEVAMQMSKDPEEYEDIGSPLEQLMNEKHVRVEERMTYKGLDRWRCGFYVYKDNEIADFIGAPDRKDNTFSPTGIMFVLTTTVDM
jgi:hypothetical protein